jgi:1-deoxy-D-xylulose-5-phosphate synthase
MITLSGLIQVGALKTIPHCRKRRKNPRQNNMIKSLNLNYSGPIDGHDILPSQRIERLQKPKDQNFLYHYHKKGLQQAEEISKYHAPGKI